MRDAATLRALRATLRPGTRLDELQWLDLITIIDAILAGRDARELYGIAAKKGAPTTTRAMQIWMAVHVRALRALEPAEPLKKHYGIVAAAWGTSDNQIAKMDRKYRTDAAAVLAGTTPEGAIQTCNELGKHFARPAKRAIEGR